MPVEMERKARAEVIVKKQNIQDQLDMEVKRRIQDNIQVFGLSRDGIDGETTNETGTRVEQDTAKTTDRTLVVSHSKSMKKLPRGDVQQTARAKWTNLSCIFKLDNH